MIYLSGKFRIQRFFSQFPWLSYPYEDKIEFKKLIHTLTNVRRFRIDEFFDKKQMAENIQHQFTNYYSVNNISFKEFGILVASLNYLNPNKEDFQKMLLDLERRFMEIYQQLDIQSLLRILQNFSEKDLIDSEILRSIIKSKFDLIIESSTIKELKVMSHIVSKLRLNDAGIINQLIQKIEEQIDQINPHILWKFSFNFSKLSETPLSFHETLKNQVYIHRYRLNAMDWARNLNALVKNVNITKLLDDCDGIILQLISKSDMNEIDVSEILNSYMLAEKHDSEIYKVFEQIIMENPWKYVYNEVSFTMIVHAYVKSNYIPKALFNFIETVVNEPNFYPSTQPSLNVLLISLLRSESQVCKEAAKQKIIESSELFSNYHIEKIIDTMIQDQIMDKSFWEVFKDKFYQLDDEQRGFLFRKHIDFFQDNGIEIE